MMRGLVLVAMVTGAAVLVPSAAEAGDPVPLPYTCNQSGGTGTVPEFTAAVGFITTDAPDPAKIFQPVTWTFDIDEPELAPPLSVDLHYLRVRIAIPANLTNVTAQAVAGTGETPNPALSAISVQTTATEIVVQLPATPTTSNRIFAGTDGSIRYPHQEGNFVNLGTPVVLPRIQVTALPTPTAANTNIEWRAPTVESKANVLGNEPEVACTPDGTPDPVIAATAVGNTRQTCDGRGVTVQLGFNVPTAGNDVIQGRAVNDTTNGLAGNDRFCGLAGVDNFRGSTGNDRAFGGLGNDVLKGDAGDDRLQGDGGADNLQGGADRDTLIGGSQRDTCNGGPQRDQAIACEVRVSIP